MKRSTAGASALLLCSLTAAGAHAETLILIYDITVDTPESSEAKNVSSQSRTLRIGSGRYRLDASGKTPKGGAASAVEIFADDRLYLLDPGEGTYTVLDRERLARAQSSRREKTLMTFGTEPPRIRREIRRTERRDQVGTQPCVIWEVYENGTLRQEQCLVPLQLIRTGKDLYETMTRYAELQAGFDDSTASLPWTDVKTTESFPVRVIDYADGKPISVRVATIVSTDEPANPMTYRIPPGMKEETRFE